MGKKLDLGHRFLWSNAVAAVLVLAAAPAAADVSVPPAPVGGSSMAKCVHICVVEMAGASCASSRNVGGTITSVETKQPFSVNNYRRGPAPRARNACTAGTATPVSLPVDLGPGQVLFFDLGFSPTVPGTHQGEIHVAGRIGNNAIFGAIPLLGQALGGNPTAPCVPGHPTELCLNGGRFKVQVDWQTRQGSSGNGNVVPFQEDDSGLFWFFSQQNLELMVKVLNGCTINNRFWVFAGGLTNVATHMTVTDTMTGIVRTYVNPLNTPFQPVQDTNAFATCP